MNRPSLTQYLDDAMRLGRTDAVALERETGVPASWTRQLKAGRMKGNADPERVAKIAKALHLDEAELWQYLGRFDLVAAIRARPEPDTTEGATADIAAAIRDQTKVFEQLLLATQAEAREAKRRADLLEQIVVSLLRPAVEATADQEGRRVMREWGRAALESMTSRQPEDDPAPTAER